MECIVCYKKSSKNVVCTHCSEKCCKKCYNTYILGSESNNCMFCGEPQTTHFVRYNIMTTNIPAFKTREAAKLLMREKAMIPDTQAQMELEQIENDVSFLVNGMDSLLTIQEKIRKPKATENIISFFLTTLDDSIEKVKTQLCDLNGYSAELIKLKSGKHGILGSFPCPAVGCNGVVLRTKCGVCNVIACNKCREIKGEGHTCDDNNIATVAAIKRDTKPCPKCKVAIYKIEGCDQMFCTHCTTGFSWRNGKLLNTSILHNPHYFEWMQNHRSTNSIDTNDCDNREWENVHNKLRSLYGFIRYEKVIKINEVLGEVFEHFELPNTCENYRTRLRLKFIKNEIDEDTWAKRLKRHITIVEKNEVTNAILMTFKDVVVDIILSTNKSNMSEFTDKCSEIASFTLDQLRKELGALSLSVPSGWEKKFSGLIMALLAP